MKITELAIGTALAALAAASVSAQESGFTWGGTLELGVDSTVSSDDPTAEIADTYGTVEAAFEAAITDRITLFGGVTLESVTDPIG